MSLNSSHGAAVHGRVLDSDLSFISNQSESVDYEDQEIELS